MTSARAAVTVLFLCCLIWVERVDVASSHTSTSSDFVTAAKAASLSLHCVMVLKGEFGLKQF
jgi:hypothetical protein